MRSGKMPDTDIRSARCAHGIEENELRTRNAIGEGLALPVGNMGQCKGAVSEGICEPAWFDCGGAADDIAQW